jgi:hypothetical protein
VLLLLAHVGRADGLAQVAIAVAQEDYEAATTALGACKPTDEETTQAAQLWGLALRFGQGEKVPAADCGEVVTPQAVVAQTKPLPRLFAVARLAAVASTGDLDAARTGVLAVLDAATKAGRLKSLTPQPDVLQIDLAEQDRRAWQSLRAEKVEPWQVWWGLAHLAFAVGRSQPWGGPMVDGFGMARALLDRALTLTQTLRPPPETEKPSNEAVDALLLEALCLVEQGDLEAARAGLSQFLTWRPGHLPARLLLATLQQEAGEEEAARTLVAEAPAKPDLRLVSYGSVALRHKAQVARLVTAHPDWKVLAAWQTDMPVGSWVGWFTPSTDTSPLNR